MVDVISKAKSTFGKGLRFITGYRYATGLLKTINNMTFFYNPTWEYGAQTKRTLPVAFFHLKAIHEVMESEVQTKKVLFYNSQKEATTDSANGAVLNVIADNIINKPKSYNLDVTVPYSTLTLLFNSALYSSEQVANVFSMLKYDVAEWSDITGWIDTVNPYMEVMKSILASLGGMNFSSSGWYGLKSLIETPMANKESLEYLWKSRTIVKLKSWDSWQFKDVVITNINITKEPTEDDVLEATISCTEVPVMVMRTYNAVRKLEKQYVGLETGIAKLSSATVTGIKRAGKQLFEGMKNASELSQEEMASFIGED